MTLRHQGLYMNDIFMTNMQILAIYLLLMMIYN